MVPVPALAGPVAGGRRGVPAGGTARPQRDDRAGPPYDSTKDRRVTRSDPVATRPDFRQHGDDLDQRRPEDAHHPRQPSPGKSFDDAKKILVDEEFNGASITQVDATKGKPGLVATVSPAAAGASVAADTSIQLESPPMGSGFPTWAART